MDYVIKLNSDNTIEIIEFPEGREFSWYSEQIGCEWIEIVRPKYSKYVLIVDEEGKLKDNHINLFASSMYGTFEHGDPIVGTCILMKEDFVDGEPDLVGMTYDEALKVKTELDSQFENANVFKRLTMEE